MKWTGLIFTAAAFSSCMTVTDGNLFKESELKEMMNSGDPPSGTLFRIVNKFGYPSFYDYFEKGNVLTVCYLIKKTTVVYVLAPFYIDKKIDYRCYYFQFDIDRADVLESKLKRTGYRIMFGKYYGYTQPPFGVLLTDIEKSAGE
jgi:hypothetical protein